MSVSTSKPSDAPLRRRSRATLIASIVLLAGLLTVGLVGLLTDPLHLPLPLLSVLDQRASVISMFIGAAGLTVSVVALFRRPADEGQALPHGGEHLHGLHGEVDVGAMPTAAHTLPPDVASFTGRHVEIDQVLKSLPNGTRPGVVGISAIDGMAGVGKTAFAVHAAHRLAPRFPDGQLFVRLHGHTPGQLPVDPADVLSTLLLWVGVAPQHIPADTEARAGLWRDRMSGKKALVVLDDASGSEQVQPLLPGASGTLVLVTSRRRLTALSGAKAITLDVLPPREAAQLLVLVADRPGLFLGDPEVAQVVALCGFLPLAISLAGGQLKHHPAWTVANLVADLASAADRPSSLQAENVSVTAAFDVSYRNLQEDQRRLFRRLGLHPGPDIDVYAAAALGDIDLATARRQLDDLFAYHLVNEPVRGRYRFHDLIRWNARARALAEEGEEVRNAAGKRLLDYYLHAARDADRHTTQGVPAGVPEVSAVRPAWLPDLSTWERAVTWMETERLNLHAVVDHAVSHRWFEHAVAIPAAMLGFLRVHGHWHQALHLHRVALETARNVSDPLAEANVLNDLGVLQSWAGDHREATETLSRARDLYRASGNLLGEANALTYLGSLQGRADDLVMAMASLTRALELHRATGNRIGQANTLNNLGIVQHLTGDHRAGIAGLVHARELHRAIGNRLREASAAHNLGCVQQATGEHLPGIANLVWALEVYQVLGDPLGQAHALNDLGAAQQAIGDLLAAATSLTRALELYRALGNRAGEAEALTTLGVVCRLTGDPQAATDALFKALELYRSLGNRSGEAAVHNDLLALSLACSTSSGAGALQPPQDYDQSPAAALSRRQRALAVRRFSYRGW
ncbi:tetratricopeptide repeat protein [Nonomuraea sp. NBC_00507]|uniref:ATP-binding protein n=1 Tax=Nonomuraea sp. NBC_00507 TaxID=2976002 RepID=UPI002E19E367